MTFEKKTKGDNEQNDVTKVSQAGFKTRLTLRSSRTCKNLSKKNKQIGQLLI